MSRARDTAEVAEEIDLKVDYSTPVNEQTGTSYTFQLADARKLTTASSASAVTLTIPPQSEVTWEDDTILRVVNYGAGAVTVAGGSGVTVTNTATTLAQYESAAAIRTGSDAWTVVPFGGGDFGWADLTATTGSPTRTTYTADGTDWVAYTFTGDGSITTSDGLVEVFAVGGGGGAAGAKIYNYHGYGGAGGVIQTFCTVTASTHNVKVGAGSNAGSGRNASTSQASFLLDAVAIGGGGAGTNDNPAGSNGGDGGSGGGANVGGQGTGAQGNDGGSGSAAGGGGAGGAGTASSGGAGVSSSFSGSSVTYAVGGYSTTPQTANTGNGCSARGTSGSTTGMSGVVIIRVPAAKDLV